MIFSSIIFLGCFLPFTLIGYYVFCFKNRVVQNVFLLVMSLFFYAWGEPVFVFLMMFSILVNWLLGLAVSKYTTKRGQDIVITLSLLFNLTILFRYKYLGFTLNSINAAFGLDFAVPETVLPIGISFFTFQAISYVIDVKRGKGEAQKNPLNVGLYIAFFPQLIAGPIVRYETIAEQIKTRKESLDKFSEGTLIFMRGVAKKVILSNQFAIIADMAFNSSPKDLSSAFAWLGAVAYTLQIFYDFSGYSEMAIGLGKMFGFEFLPNFNFPYISKSISEFWRRWHISLGTWFRDYVYFPLGGSRVGKGRLIFNLFVVWSLTGIWHGANWTFIAWGLLYFVLIAFEKVVGFEKRKIPAVFCHVYTMLFVILGWVLFRADNLSYALRYMKVMFGMGGTGLMSSEASFHFLDNIVLLAVGVLCSTPIFLKLRNKLDCTAVRYVVLPLFYTLLLFVSISYLVKSNYNPFIYFNF